MVPRSRPLSENVATDLPTSALVGSSPLPLVTLAPVSIETMTIASTAASDPALMYNVLGDRRRRGGLVVSDKDVDRHQHEERRQIRDRKVEEPHRLADVGLVDARVSIETCGVEREQSPEHGRRHGVDDTEVRGRSDQYRQRPHQHGVNQYLQGRV